MSLLTDEQLLEWRGRIHEEYTIAQRAMERAAYRERLFRHYVLRHLADQDKLRAQRAGLLR